MVDATNDTTEGVEQASSGNGTPEPAPEQMTLGQRRIFITEDAGRDLEIRERRQALAEEKLAFQKQLAEARKERGEQGQKANHVEAVNYLIESFWFHVHQARENKGWYSRKKDEDLWQHSRSGAALLDNIRRSCPPGMAKWNDALGIRNLAACAEEFNGPPFDANPELCGLPNGKVLDLKTGAVKKSAVGKDFISKRLGASPEAGTPRRFLRFLLQVLPSAAEVRWLLRYAGYAMTAHTREHQFAYFYGNGRNGKGVLMQVLQRALGDYATGVSSSGLLGRDDLGQHPTWLASLDGARLITLDDLQDEPCETAKLKQLVAGDRQTARFMRMDPFDFTPVGKFILSANHLLRVKRGSYALYERIRVLPFPRTFAAASRDPKLINALLAELPQIVNLLAQEAKAYLAEGLLAETPAMAEQRGEFSAKGGGGNEQLERWIAERLQFKDGAFTASKDLIADLKTQGNIVAKTLKGEVQAAMERAAWAQCKVQIAAKLRKLDRQPVRGWDGVALRPLPVESSEPGQGNAVDF